MNKVESLIAKIPEVKPGIVVKWANDHFNFSDDKQENKVFKAIIQNALIKQKEKMVSVLNDLKKIHLDNRSFFQSILSSKKNQKQQDLTKDDKDNKTNKTNQDLENQNIDIHNSIHHKFINYLIENFGYNADDNFPSAYGMLNYENWCLTNLKDLMMFISHWYNNTIKEFNSNKYEVYLFYDKNHNAELRYRTNNIQSLSGPFIHLNELIKSWNIDLKIALDYFINKKNSFSINNFKGNLLNANAQSDLLGIASSNPVLQYFASKVIYDDLYKLDNKNKDHNMSLDDKIESILNYVPTHKTNEEQRAEILRKLDDNVLNKDSPTNKSTIKSVFKQ